MLYDEQPPMIGATISNRCLASAESGSIARLAFASSIISLASVRLAASSRRLLQGNRGTSQRITHIPRSETPLRGLAGQLERDVEGLLVGGLSGEKAKTD